MVTGFASGAYSQHGGVPRLCCAAGRACLGPQPSALGFINSHAGDLDTEAKEETKPLRPRHRLPRSAASTERKDRGSQSSARSVGALNSRPVQMEKPQPLSHLAGASFSQLRERTWPEPLALLFRPNAQRESTTTKKGALQRLRLTC
jgi:hypothetical protein